MNRSITASRLSELVDGFGRTPAYAGLAEALTVLIGDGRIALGARLPSERDLAAELAVSRTTVTRAYAALVESGFADARRGAGTFTRVPHGTTRAFDRSLTPLVNRQDVEAEMIDLGCAASSARPGVAEAYAAAAAEFPAYLGGHGYFPSGLPRLQEAIASSYVARGLPTEPEQIMVTPGALAAAAIVAAAYTRPGDRVLLESPTYPNCAQTLRHAGARLVPLPMTSSGWDLEELASVARSAGPRLAYLIPDFQNPTGHLMSAGQRQLCADALRAAGTRAVIDESHAALALDGQEMPPPFAAYAPDAITLGSTSKSFWGGLRVGWVRAPDAASASRLAQARVRLDLGSPVFEQLVAARLLSDPEPALDIHRAHLRRQRDALVAALRSSLPSWTFTVPGGGQMLWVRLPAAVAVDVAVAAERMGVLVAPGPVFAVSGGLGSHLRLPWTRPVDELERAVDVLRDVFENLPRRGDSGGWSARVVVA